MLPLRNNRSELFQNQLFKDVTRMDLDNMITNTDLDLQEPIVEALLVQSVLGHAQHSHGEFGKAKLKFPNATIPDIIAAANLDVAKIKAARQGMINQVYDWVNQALKKRVSRLVLNGQPLLGVNFLRHYTIDSEFVLRGMVLAGFMDNYEARMDTIAKYKTTIKGDPLEIGGGKTYLVDMETLLMSGITIKYLEERGHDDQGIEFLQELGVIVDKAREGVEPAYIRRKVGPGTSDDLAFIMVGRFYGQENPHQGISAMLGAFVVDAVDTYDKCVSYPARNGLDEVLAESIQEAWIQKTGSPLVTPTEIHRVIYYSAKSNNPKVSASSSHRRFIQFAGAEKYKPAFQAHVSFVQGEEPDLFRVGFQGTPSNIFYARAKRRVEHMMQEAA